VSPIYGRGVEHAWDELQQPRPVFSRQGRRKGRRDGEAAWEGVESLIHASNSSLPPLDLVLIDFETLILIEIKSCVRFSGYTMVEALSGGDFF